MAVLDIGWKCRAEEEGRAVAKKQRKGGGMGHFSKEDDKVMQEVYERAVEAAVKILTDGADRAMNEFN